MPTVAVLDASVLHPMPLCDTLLRLADADLYRPVWSPRLLDELSASLQRRGYAREAAFRRCHVMEEFFPEALEIRGDRFEASVPKAIDRGDRHVVATAFAARADTIVTANLSHFPADILEELDIDVLGPDEFLLELLKLDAGTVLAKLREEAEALRSPNMTFDELLGRLNASSPDFVKTVRSLS